MKHTLLAFLLVTLSFEAMASYDLAPPSFSYKSGQAVFVDFQNAVYNLRYNYQGQTATAESTINFTVIKPGYPIFDLVPDPTDVTLDGVAVDVASISDPDAQTKYRVINQQLAAGTYQLKLKHTIKENVVFNAQGVASGFWLGDLSDRRYLEAYIPSNLEFDHYPKTFNVQVTGVNSIDHTVKANGKVSRLSNNAFEVSYPAHFTSSSVFFHLFPTKAITRNVSFYYTSIDGRKLPVDIYAVVETDQFLQQTKAILAELEADYGPFPHDQVLIYGTSLARGGMEYSGATATGLVSLGHELFHSYNARGVMPANGNSGWMDEGLSTWRGDAYRHLETLPFENAKISGHSQWRRSTDRDSYVKGSAFLSHIAHKLNMRGLFLKDFLKEYFKRNMFSSVTTEMFEKELSESTGMDFSEEFNRYIYGRYTPSTRVAPTHDEDPEHPHYSSTELLNITMPSPN
jgi:hypothetical protein